MKLVTTVGVELTYVPAAVQIALNRGGDFHPDNAPDRSLCEGFSWLMRQLLYAKKIETYDIGTDPGCVEISTQPYDKLRPLLAVARKIRKEAEAIGMVVAADYTNGGGAHVHTGVMGKTLEERGLYRGRMMLFGALNPWLAWATCNVNDDINAQPLTLKHMRSCSPEKDWQDTLRMARQYEAALVKEQRELHTANVWGNPNASLRLARHMREYRAGMRHWKKQERGSRLGAVPCTMKMTSMWGPGDKDHMLRGTGYGDNGTIEFRCFEMGGEDKLARNIKLANAICDYVSRWDITEIDMDKIPVGSEIYNMKWSEARKGWLNMLTLLGLDPAEYRDETAQIARRWRWCRVQEPKLNPTAVDAREVRPSSLPPKAAVEPYVVERCQARRARRMCRNGRFAAPLEGPGVGGAGAEVDYSLAA